jgi:uncharacterized protein
MIFDGHTHFFKRFGPLKGIDADAFSNGLRQEGASGAVVFTLEGFLTEDCSRFNDEIFELTQQQQGFLHGFGTVHPRMGDGAISEMRRCVNKLGMKGFKFHSWLQAFCASGEDVVGLVREAARLQVPVLFHDGTPPYSATSQVAYLARCVPEATVILGHSGLRDCIREALYYARKYPNIVLQFCGTPQIGMREMVGAVGPSRCVFGSDYPFAGKALFKTIVKQVGELSITEEEKRGILGENMRRLLKL